MKPKYGLILNTYNNCYDECPIKSDMVYHRQSSISPIIGYLALFLFDIVLLYIAFILDKAVAIAFLSAGILLALSYLIEAIRKYRTCFITNAIKAYNGIDHSFEIRYYKRED